MNINNNFNPYGRGMEYPLFCANGSALVVTGEPLIAQSIRQLLHIPLGSLPATPSFGSRLEKILFEPIDTIAQNLGATYIREALKQEGRISVLNIASVVAGATIIFTISYQIKATGEMLTEVYPFNRNI